MGFRQDADKLFLSQGIQLHPDRKTTLQLRNQIGRFGRTEGTGGDEEDMVRLTRP